MAARLEGMPHGSNDIDALRSPLPGSGKQTMQQRDAKERAICSHWATCTMRSIGFST
jgi:hypothetical protein